MSQTNEKNVVRIVLVDDHPIVRDGLAEVINREPDLKVCGGGSPRGYDGG